MAADVTMPRLSDSMEEGIVVSWLKGPGDEVAVGDELVEIETDKANMVYEADVAGTLIELVVSEGDAAPVGAVIARVGEPGEAGGSSNGAPTAPADGASAPAPASAPTPTPAPPATAAVPSAPAPPTSDAPAGGRVKASPIARRIAEERGVELAELVGSGPGGRIVKADVENAAPPVSVPSSPPAGPPSDSTAAPAPAEAVGTARGEVEVVEPTKLQQAVARRMSESKATAPHFYLEARIDMTRAVEGRAQLKASGTQVVPSLNDMVVKACALALREFPKANGAYRDGRFELYGRVNVGVAVAAQDALIVPTVFDADRKGLRTIAIETRALAEKVRAGQITPPEISGGTFTVS
ncbi:MAG TPA: dihydrolipoamide acetyltransferase family protein, partial [Solirubrobacterales bacterium]|nr:dihydrolipoamide acetyltransferase family protein [Solirubrobacterales bacterium]